MVALRRVVATAGNGAFGRLGHGLEGASSRFLRIVGSLIGYDVKAVACGGAHTCVLTEDGSLFTFGLNSHGQLGHSEGDKFVAVPIEVTLPDPVAGVAAGEHHTLAVTRGGEVWAWGSHESGQLGIGQSDKSKHAEPRLVKELTGRGVVGLAAGSEHSLALAEGGGELYTWGHGGSGALGLGRGAANTDWVPVPRRLRWGPMDSGRVMGARVVAGPFSSGLITALAEHAVGALSLGQNHSMAAAADGSLTWMWGTDSSGTLGQGEGVWVRMPMPVPLPLKTLPAGTRVVDVCAGWQSSAVVDAGGRLHTWGSAGAANSDSLVLGDAGAGQLGLGDERDRWAPEQVVRLHTSPQRFYDLRASYIKPWRVQQVAAGRTHMAAVIQVELDARDVA